MTHPTPEHGDDGPLALYTLTFVDEGDQVVIGRPDIDSFAVFPADAAAVVQRLRQGEDPASAAEWYQAAYGEPVDIDDFVATLHDLGFIRPAGEEPADETVPSPVRWQRLGAAVFSPAALALYTAFTAAAVYLMVAVTSLRPEPSKVFFSRSLLVVMGATCAGQLAGIAWHEGFHVLAGRRLGLASKLSIGRRLYFVVFQTTLVGLMGVPSRKRILPFCAGLIADALLVSALTVLAGVGRLANWPSSVPTIAVAMGYVTILRMLWQVMFFMETDLYHVLASALRCPDLHKMTRTYLRNRFVRLRGRPEQAVDESSWTARDLRTVRRYAPFVAVGSIAMIGLAAVVTVPILAGLAVRTYHGVRGGGLASPWFWDSLVAATVILSQFAIAAAVAVRDHKRRLITPDRS
jgi:hypothetical protein